ncbi:uncharacterized protein LOC125501698 [Athalia rosae]|uniref:uncharacterized protein LOC125501698 n=1 Tax=Athalia rosae TaxID=37344 RepID=UPI0020341D9D|nr:uncharacterized protein LOC125501698 [Athalia rosae]
MTSSGVQGLREARGIKGDETGGTAPVTVSLRHAGIQIAGRRSGYRRVIPRIITKNTLTSDCRNSHEHVAEESVLRKWQPELVHPRIPESSIFRSQRILVMSAIFETMKKKHTSLCDH